MNTKISLYKASDKDEIENMVNGDSDRSLLGVYGKYDVGETGYWDPMFVAKHQTMQGEYDVGALGFVCGCITPASGIMVISKLFVVKEYRREGIGKELLKSIEEYAYHIGGVVKGILLIVYDENYDMQEFLLKNGYVQNGERPVSEFRHGKFIGYKFYLKKLCDA